MQPTMLFPTLMAALALFLPAPAAAQSSDLLVPQQFPSIQAAIDAATAGDRVLVAPGTYEERIDFLGKAIHVRSTDGPEITTIDASGLPEFPFNPSAVNGIAAVVRFVNGEGEDSTLEGFTVTGADGDIQSWGHWLKVEAVVSYPGTARLVNCIVAGNKYTGVAGRLTLEFCALIGNGFSGMVHHDGGGGWGRLTLRGCLVEGNYAYTGGGLLLHAGSLVEDSIIRGNSASEGGGGGGIYCEGEVLVRRSWIHGNSAGLGGWGSAGQAISGGVVENCVISGHNGKTEMFSPPGVLYLSTVKNSVLWGNQGVVTNGVTATYSLVQGGHPGVGNFDADPMFVDLANGDLRLLPGSPCMDAGDPSLPLDPDGTIADVGKVPFWQEGVCGSRSLSSLFPGQGERLGQAVSLWANLAALGLSDHPGAGPASGRVRVMRRTGAGWQEEAVIQPEDLVAGDRFGHAVALDGGRLVVGARGVALAGPEAGQARVYRRVLGAWLEEAVLLPDDVAPGDWFGASVAIHGDRLAVAALKHNALGTNSGAVYVFSRVPGSDGLDTWVQEAKLLASDGAANNEFGKSVDLHGDRVVVGANGASQQAPNAGAAYVFRREGGSWIEEARLSAPHPEPFGQFGTSVAIDGERVLVGARYQAGSGAAFVFRREAGQWIHEQKLQPDAPLAGEHFGWDVALDGARALVGSRLSDGLAPASGAAFLFERQGSVWQQRRQFHLPGATTGDLAGSAVALFGDYGVVGAPGRSSPLSLSGAAFAFHLPSPHCPPTFEAFSSGPAWAPGTLLAAGTDLEQVAQLWFAGAPVAILGSNADTLAFAPGPSPPGPSQLTGEGTWSQGTFEASGQVELLPSLRATSSGIGGTLRLEISNGQAGFFALAMAADLLPAGWIVPLPPAWYGLSLNPTTLALFASGLVPSHSPVVLDLPIPIAPDLSGQSVHFQAWAQQGLPGQPITASFTNAVRIDL